MKFAAPLKDWRSGRNGRPKQQRFRREYERLQVELLFLTDPGSRGYGIHTVQEATRPEDTAIRIRGEAERQGPVVPRGFLTAFRVSGAPEIDKTQSGRLQLAQWLTSPENPLTARVMRTESGSSYLAKAL